MSWWYLRTWNWLDKKNKKHEKQQHEKLEKEESIDNYKAPGKTDSGQHHVE